MRSLGILAAGLAVTASAILFLRLAPRPPYRLINDGSVSLFSQDLRDEARGARSRRLAWGVRHDL